MSQADYRRTHKKEILASAKRYREKNAKKVRAAIKKWEKANPEKVKFSKRKYRENNREKLRAANRRYFRNNFQKCKEMLDRWRKENPEKAALQVEARRARKARARGSFTSSEWFVLCKRYNNCCLCCGRHRKLTIDHIIPISKGGTNYISNIQPLCGPCNSSKGTKTTDYRKKRRVAIRKEKNQS